MSELFLSDRPRCFLDSISELFDIIVYYPDSKPALLDLKECLGLTRQRSELIVSLSSTFKKRLLIPGAMTTDIIQQFISTVKVLRFLDPQLPAAASLAAVSEHIKEYLRGRRDTVRCIVTMLTEGDSAELFEEDRPGSARAGLISMDTDKAGHDDSGDSDEDAERDAHWTPQPVEFEGGIGGGGGREVDIISMLVGIYGSKELFVNEYRDMLGTKLLEKPLQGSGLDKEYRTLEQLKQRFGEESLHKCEVMLKDVKTSHRCSTNINAKLNVDGPEHDAEADNGDEGCPTRVVQPMIISQVFWPQLQPAGAKDSLKFPPEMAKALASYNALYAKINKPRVLQWAPSAGQVRATVPAARYRHRPHR